MPPFSFATVFQAFPWANRAQGVCVTTGQVRTVHHRVMLCYLQLPVLTNLEQSLLPITYL